MKRLLLILILTLSFQTLAKADDIKDFQIEGISVGDSLLDHYNKNVLDNIKRHYYPNSKKMVGLYSQVFNNNLKNYEAIQFSVTPDDYQIEAIGGLTYEFENKKKECYLKMEKIFDEIQSLFPNSETIKEKERAHAADTSGKSVGKIYKINLDNGIIRVTCTDWAKEMDYADSLKISIHTTEHMNWINSEAY